VYLAPSVLPVGERARLRLSIASSRTDEPVTGIVRLHPPAGWRIEPRERPFGLDPGGYSQSEVVVIPPSDAVPGAYRVRAEFSCGGQRYEDVSVLLLGDAARIDELAVSLRTTSVRLRPGQQAEIVVGLVSTAPGVRRAQVQLISPWGCWDLLPEWDRGADIPAGGQAEVRFPVRAASGMEPGRWWALVKVASEGRCFYTEAVSIEVIGERAR
jgi:alpha-mannosidase